MKNIISVGGTATARRSGKTMMTHKKTMWDLLIRYESRKRQHDYSVGMENKICQSDQFKKSCPYCIREHIKEQLMIKVNKDLSNVQ